MVDFSRLADITASAFAETVKWTQDKAPHRKGAFGAVILHGDSSMQNAGNNYGTISADPWYVTASAVTSLVADIAVGDTFTLLNGVVLTIQQITPDVSGWVFKCTANERPPVS